MFDKKRRFEAVILAAVTVLASFSVNWSSLSPKANEETTSDAQADSDTAGTETAEDTETTMPEDTSSDGTDQTVNTDETIDPDTTSDSTDPALTSDEASEDTSDPSNNNASSSDSAEPADTADVSTPSQSPAIRHMIRILSDADVSTPSQSPAAFLPQQAATTTVNAASLTKLEDIVQMRFHDENNSEDYTGSAITPDYYFINPYGQEYTLAPDAYTISYQDEDDNAVDQIVNAGDYTVTAVGNESAGYTGSVSATFTVNQRQITKNNISYTISANDRTYQSSVSDKTFVFTGSAITPAISNVSLSDSNISLDSSDFILTGDTSATDLGRYNLNISGTGNFDGTVKISYRVVGNLNNFSVRIGKKSSIEKASASNSWKSGYAVDYDGSTQEPKVVLCDMDGDSVAEDDYSVRYSNNTNATDKAAVTITGADDSDYAGQTITAYFTINKLALPSGGLSIPNDKKTYTGSDISLTADDVKVVYYTNGFTMVNPTVLTYGTDFTLHYSADQKNAGTVTVTAEGVGNYTGTTSSKTFTIEPLDISTRDDISVKFTDFTTQADVPSYVFTGDAIEPPIALIYTVDGNETAFDSSDYNVSYSDNVNVGDSAASVKVTGKGNLTGSITKNFSIAKKSMYGLTYTIGNVTIEGSDDQGAFFTDYSATYNGKAQEPVITVKYGSRTLTAGKDYKVEYVNHTNAKTASEDDKDNSPVAKITGEGNYDGNEIDLYFTINKKDISSDTVSVKPTIGDDLTPAFVLTDSEAGADLAETTDYVITQYDSTKSDNSKPGKAGSFTAVLTGAGNYTGTRTVDYSIGKDLSDAVINIYGDNTNSSDKFEYLAGNMPYVTVSLDGKELTGPQYENGSYVNNNTSSDYVVTFTPSSLNAGSSFTVTISANTKSASAKQYYGSCSKIQGQDYQVPVTKRDLSQLPSAQLSFSDSKAASDSGTGKSAKDPIIYTCDGSSTITPNISVVYTPNFTPSVLKKPLSTKSETVTGGVTKINSVASTDIDISKAATGNMTFTGSGNYEDDITVYYKVQAATADNITVEAVPDITYDGAEHKDISPVVKLGNMTLTAGTDYTISYSGSEGYTNVGTYDYTITGTGTVFSGSKAGTFKIVPANLSTMGAAVSTISDQVYTGNAIELTATKAAVSLPSGAYFNVTANGNLLTPNTSNAATNTPGAGDYWYTYSRDDSSAGADHTNPGKVNLTIHGNGNYTGTITGSFYITADISSNLFTVNGIPDALTLSSNGTLKDDAGNAFTYPDSISITYQDNVNNKTATLPSSYYSVSVTSGGSIYTSGDKTLTITGISSNAKNSVSRDVKVTGDASTAEVSLLSTTSVKVSAKQSDGSYIVDYTGSQPQPTILVSFGGKRLTEGKDYIVNNGIMTDAGKGAVTVTGTGSYAGAPVTIPVYTKYNLSKAKVVFDPSSYSYTGAEIYPDSETVTIGSKVLSRNTDYQIDYRNNINAGTAYASVTPYGEGLDGTTSTGSATGTFKVTPVTLTDEMVTVDTTLTDNYTGIYNGKEQKPDVIVEANYQTLEVNKDYTVKYSANVNAGQATVTVKGKGGYTGMVTKTFTISPKDISDIDDSGIIIAKAHFAGDGVAVEPAITVKDGGSTLKKGTDYNYDSNDFANNRKVSLNNDNARITIHGYGNYTGSKTTEFAIEPLDLSSDSQITLEKAEAEYTGNEITPTVQVTIDDGTNNPVLDPKYYTVNVTGSTGIKDAGKYTCNITASEDYSDSITGQKSFTFTVNPKEINFLDDSWNTTTDSDDDAADTYALYYQDENGTWQSFGKNTHPSFSYSYAAGKEVPAIYLVDTSDDHANKTSISEGININGVKLINGKDFTIKYSNNGLSTSAENKSSAPTITISGTGNYSGSITRNYSIGKDITTGISVKLNKKTFYYNGSEQKPTVTYVKYNGTTLTEGTDYKVSIPSSVKAGDYSVTVKGIGEYYGTYEVPYTIKGKKLSSKQIGVEFTDSEIREENGEYYYFFNEDVDKFEPKVAVYNNSVKSADGDGILLTEGTDYTLSYGDNTHDNYSAGTTGIVHVTLTGDYSGTAVKTFTIKKIDISDFALSFTGTDIEGDDSDGYTAEYSGDAITSDFYIEGSAPGDDTVYDIDTTDSDVTKKISYSYTDNTYPGKATLTINGIGNYTGTVTKNFSISGNIEEATVTVGDATYTGAEVDPPVTVTYFGKTLSEGTDYTLSYTPSSDYSSGTVTVTGEGYYSGSVTADYTLSASGDIFTMSLPNTKYPYTGRAIKQVPVITNSATGETVTNATIAYSNSSDGSACILPGTVTVTATIPVMNTSVQLSGTYSIIQGSIYDCTITGIDSYYNYTGSTIKPLTKSNISVTYDGMTIPSDCYEIQYPDSGYVLPGTYTASVVGKGVFGGYRDFHYQIRVPKVENLSTTAVSKTSASLAWDGVGVATGYRITYSKDGKQVVKKTTDNNITLTGLPESSNITVNVSAYLKSGTKSYYSVVTPVSVGTKLTTPSISAIQAGSSKNTISWNQISSSGGYMIYRSTSKNGTYSAIASVPANRAYFTDTRAKSGRKYYYKISTYRIAADGSKYDETAKSDASSVTTR